MLILPARSFLQVLLYIEARRISRDLNVADEVGPGRQIADESFSKPLSAQIGLGHGQPVRDEAGVESHPIRVIVVQHSNLAEPYEIETAVEKTAQVCRLNELARHAQPDLAALERGKIGEQGTSAISLFLRLLANVPQRQIEIVDCSFAEQSLRD